MDRVKLALMIFCLLAGIGLEFAFYKMNSTACLILNGAVAYFSLIFWIITTCPSFQDQMQALIDRDATRQQEMSEDEPLINREQDKAGPDHKQSQTNSEQGLSISRSGLLPPQQGVDDEIGGGHDQKNTWTGAHIWCSNTEWFAYMPWIWYIDSVFFYEINFLIYHIILSNPQMTP